MTQTNARIIDYKQAESFLNSRIPLSSSHVGQQVVLQIQGSGTFQSAAEQEAKTPGQKAYFDKYIHNLKANSLEAMSRPENRLILAAALKAETEGLVDEASALYNEYLNAVQISFNVIAGRGRKFENGDQVKAIVGIADTKSGHKAIVVNDVRYMAPVLVEKIKYSLTDLLGDVAPAPAATVTADDKVVS